MNAEQMYETRNHEMVTPGKAFMGFLMGVGAICVIWFFAGLLQVLSKMVG